MTFAGWSLKRWAVLGLMLAALTWGVARTLPISPCTACREEVWKPPKLDSCTTCASTGWSTLDRRLTGNPRSPTVYKPARTDGEWSRLAREWIEAAPNDDLQIELAGRAVPLSLIGQALLLLAFVGIWLVDPLIFPVQERPLDRGEAVHHRAHRIAWSRARRRLRLLGAVAVLAIFGTILGTWPTSSTDSLPEEVPIFTRCRR
jgi:hypothetical protein